MQRTLRVVAIIAAVLLVLALILGLVWSGFSRRAYPDVDGNAQLDGLSAPVDIYRDSYGIPHIYGETQEDLFFAEGYVHAQDRFWQMEFQRRVGSARLSELFGDSSLSTDIYLRTLGIRYYAEQDYAQFDPQTKSILDAYSAGVNAYISQSEPAELGLEFALLELQGVEIEIEAWTGIDSLAWARMMIYDQSDDMETELLNLDVLQAVGSERLADFVPGYREGRPTIVPDFELDAIGATGTNFSALAANFTAEELAALSEIQLVGGFDPDLLAGYGFGAGASNSWAISGDLTTTGTPLLADDPHMSGPMPALWYEVGLHCVEKSPECPLELRGFSLPGVPGILIGHNDRIAWGLTNASYDSEDVFVERINSENPDQYEVNGEWVDMEIRREEIRIQGQEEPYVLRVRSTRHGPIATDHMVSGRDGITFGEDGPELLALSYSWTALQPINSVRALLMLNVAQDYDDFREALSYFDAGKQNFIYADVEGNIGYQMAGLIPIRAGGDGSLPMPGWTDEYGWTGYIPYDEMPRLYNPEQGYIVTANHLAAGGDYPYLLGTEPDRGFRAQRLVDMIEADTNGISIDDMRAMQSDNLSIPALELIPYLADLSFGDPAVSLARDGLLVWDAQLHMDSPQAALYAYTWFALLDNLYHDQLPENTWPSGGGKSSESVYWLLQEPDNPWWDDVTTPDVTEDRDMILTHALEDGYAAGVEQFGPDPAEWRWGDIHTKTFVNSTLGRSGIGLIESIFNRGPVATSGGESVVNKTSWDAAESPATTSLPALRQIIDLGDLSNSLMIFTTGQSGHPGHQHYDDLIEMWRLFDYHSSLWAREDVEADSRDHLRLEPSE